MGICCSQSVLVSILEDASVFSYLCPFEVVGTKNTFKEHAALDLVFAINKIHIYYHHA